jgi:hypothetical protein
MTPFSIAADLVSPALIGTSAAVVRLLISIPGQALSGEGLVARLALNASGSLATDLENYHLPLIVYPFALALAICLFLFLKETSPEDVYYAKRAT